MNYTGPITPEENDVFTKALRFLYGRRLAMEGMQAEIIITREKPDEAEPSRVPA